MHLAANQTALFLAYSSRFLLVGLLFVSSGDVDKTHPRKPRTRLGGEGSHVAANPGVLGAVCGDRGSSL